MQFGYTIVYVADPGATTLAFAQHRIARDNLGRDYVAADGSTMPLGMEIGLLSADVTAAAQRAVEAGATLLKAPSTKPWGQTVAYVRTPDGTLVELCTPMG